MPKLLRDLKSFYRTSAREHLPWRATHDPYKILVSEVMLQQTQVERVIPFYERFIQRFPTPEALAKAPLSEVLKYWSGLGYNRRGKFLQEAAKLLQKAAELPKKREMNGSPTPFLGSSAELTTEFLESLPGVGPYTARAIATFAYNRPEIFIETNIRTVFIHYCFAKRHKLDSLVSDAEILPLVEKALKASRMKPRDFYAALMDYGSHLKQRGIKLNVRSKHYNKQSKFEGSYRQLRGAILRALLEDSKDIEQLVDITGRKQSDITHALANLSGEGIITIKRGRISIAD
jgi:A/G-specific adenine glycosylase